MSRPWKERTAVYIVRVGESFKPTSICQWPETFCEARLHVRNISLTDARATVRAFNKAAMEKRAANVPGWDRQWAIAGCCVRAKGWDRERPAGVKSDSGSEYPPAYTPEFLEFWEAYPSIRKTGKCAAWLAWQGAVKRAWPADILAAVKPFAVSPLGRSRFCPGPTQWLNEDRWLNDRTAWQRSSDDPMRDRRAGSRPANQAKPPRSYTSEEIERLLSVCNKARLPEVAGVSPDAWWRSFITISLATGLRPCELLEVRRKGSGWLFPWPHRRQSLHATFRFLVRAAGIDLDGRHGLHGLRCTWLEQQLREGGDRNRGAELNEKTRENVLDKAVRHSGDERSHMCRVVLSDTKPFYVEADRIRLENGCVVLLTKAVGVTAIIPLSQLVAITNLHSQAKGGAA